MALRINEGWKVLISTLGLSLMGCGGAALEEEGSLGRTAQRLDGEVTLTLNGDSEVTLECGVDAWAEPGATATDGDNNPLEVITYNSGNDEYGPGPQAGAEGTYYVQYAAWDANWNIVNAIRTVTVTDTLTPTLTLNGEETIIHPCNTHFQDPGVTATDACYGNLAGAVAVTGQVNSWVEGTYTLQYDVSDAAGHGAPSVTRTVEVVACPWNQ